MDEKVGLTLIQGIIRNEQANGHAGWDLFQSIDVELITKYFGLLAANWAVEQRDLQIKRLIETSQKIPVIKTSIEATEKLLIK